jgi:hypothetical protein
MEFFFLRTMVTNLKNHPDTQLGMVHFVTLNFQAVLCKVNPWVGASQNKGFGQDCPTHKS